MKDEQSSEETQELFETLEEFINTLKESPVIESQIGGILTLMKSIIELIEADRNVTSSHGELLHNLSNSSRSMVNVATELDEKITTINSNFLQLAREVKKLAEATAKIPSLIDFDNLIKTLNEHAEEINENTASIKEIKDKLDHN